jgi:hypothetical protein
MKYIYIKRSVQIKYQIDKTYILSLQELCNTIQMILPMKKAQGGVLLFDISTTSCCDCQIIEPSCQTDA